MIIQSLLLSDISSSILSSSSSSILGVVAFIVRLLFAFLFDASISTFLTTSRISYILKTNFLLIAMCFPFLYSLRTRSSSLASVSSLYKRAFLEEVLSKATPDRLIYYFIGVLRVEERTILLSSDVASYSSIPSGSELSSRDRSRLFRVVIECEVVGGIEVGI